MRQVSIARVAIEQAAYQFDKLYSYRVPAALTGLFRGCRVTVPFGGGNRTRQGIVMALEEGPDVSSLKEIRSVLDKEPLLSDELLDLALFMKDRLFCTVFEAVRAMLPVGLCMRIRMTVLPETDIPAEKLEALSEEERRVFQTVCSLMPRHPDGVETEKLMKRLGLSDSRVIDHLIGARVLRRNDDAFRRMGDATIRMIALSGEDWAERAAALRCTPKQMGVLKLLADVGCASVREACYFSGVTPAVPAALERKGLISFREEAVQHTVVTADAVNAALPSLSDGQTQVFQELLTRYRSHTACCDLLYGVTGSGKTQVYMHLIQEVVADGRQVIVMVPEISLTPQTMNLFIVHFGQKVAVLHSGLSMGERMDEWKRIRRGEATIVVGTRSAVFAPCDRIGLVVMDEEQEHTYKSESSPRYHAREVAKFRCSRHGAMLLLASATPSVESFNAAVSGRYALHRLPARFGEAELPEVTVADMREEETDGLFGRCLEKEMRDCLAAHKQIILLLNRRGYHTAVSCRSCGTTLTCPFCSISMTYHRANHRMVCHYCGHMEPKPDKCPSCGSDKIRFSGVGTQKIEEELQALFPDVPVLRMDADTTMSRFAYEKNFSAFAAGKYPIMIGTQMVAKGLDFPGVGLVGILSADQSLYSDDFRSFETTFALLTQVIGRAGRRESRGKAVIQTYTPENYVIRLASRQDYDQFFKTEIAARRMMTYPPYSDLCQFGFVGEDEVLVGGAAHRFLKALQMALTGEYSGVPLIALDPTPALVARASGKYRYKLLTKVRNDRRTRTMIDAVLTAFLQQAENKRVTVFVDMNPTGVW